MDRQPDDEPPDDLSAALGIFGAGLVAFLAWAAALWLLW